MGNIYFIVFLAPDVVQKLDLLNPKTFPIFHNTGDFSHKILNVELKGQAYIERSIE